MGYNLTIDQGNSAAKVAVWNGVDIIYNADFKHLVSENIHDILTQLPLIDKAIFCSVTNDGVEIIEYLKQQNVKTIILSHSTLLPISNTYKTPQSLGLDRLAAAVGAWSLYKDKDLLVIDLGTAITYDVVTSQGCYIGGNIAPGVTMRLSALHNYTQRLPLVDPHGNCPLWGNDTITAIRSGVLTGIVGEINHYKNHLGKDHVVVLTGGSASMIKSMLDFDIEIDHHLVTRGLNSILIYNENN